MYLIPIVERAPLGAAITRHHPARCGSPPLQLDPCRLLRGRTYSRVLHTWAPRTPV